jgi:hypothetical protein
LTNERVGKLETPIASVDLDNGADGQYSISYWDQRLDEYVEAVNSGSG